MNTRDKIEIALLLLIMVAVLCVALLSGFVGALGIWRLLTL